MKTLILLLLPFLGFAQQKPIEVDTLKAELKIKQGNWIKPPVIGYVVLTKDCEVVEYLRVNTWKRKERLTSFSKKHVVVDYRLIK